MKTKIETIIKREVDSVLSEMDIEGQIDRITDPKRIEAIIQREAHDLIRQKVAEAIERAIFNAIHKNQPIIDAYTADKVRGLIFKIDEATREDQ